MTLGPARGLRELARLHGLQTAYYDASKVRRTASADTIFAVLRGLGVAVETPDDVPAALRDRHAEIEQEMVEPVLVAWDGRLDGVGVHFPVGASGTAAVTIDIEGGGHISQAVDLSRTRRFSLRKRLPFGYHRLRLRAGKRRAAALVISAPTRAYAPGGSEWGVFLPLYAVRTKQNWGSGDLADFRSLIDWTADLGGTSVATLPLFAAYFAEPFDPSPYSPASRLFWNEFYINVESLPELADCPAARQLIASREVQRQIAKLRAGDTVDYAAGMALKRRVLKLLAAAHFRSRRSSAALATFLVENPRAEDYARFRAVMERRRSAWPAWPEPLRSGTISDADFRQEDMRYHLYAQMAAADQMSGVAAAARRRNVRLYLDMPLGAGRESYDAWRERDSFALGLSAGAPPDDVFTLGQNWEFPPMHPRNARKEGYAYWIASLRKLMAVSGVIRIDHVMGLHRLYCIPEGAAAHDGLYIRYHAGDLYAILTLESHRSQTLVVGEDLGTVPSYVRPDMRRHAIHRSYVAQARLRTDRSEALPEPPPLSVGSLNTHDMPPFAAFWWGTGIGDQVALGLLSERDAAAARRRLARVRAAAVAYLRRGGWLRARRSSATEVQRALLCALGESRARFVMANLEDLWLEADPQNVPGTGDERGNWRRKARFALEELGGLDAVQEPLLALDAARSAGRTRTARNRVRSA